MEISKSESATDNVTVVDKPRSADAADAAGAASAAGAAGAAARWAPGARHGQVALLFLAMVLCYCMRVDMTMAIVAITDPAADDSVDWSMQEQSIVLSSFFWGYVVLILPSGELAARYGGKLLITICVAGTAVMTVLLPTAVRGGWQWVCACRVVQGVAQGFLFPAVHNLIGKWVPLHEKSLLGTIIYSGGQLGTALQLMVSGALASSWGWRSIFYVNAVLGALWTALYLLLGASSPQEATYISEEERSYIQNSLGQLAQQKKLKTPWKSMLTSVPCVALLVAHCGQDYGFWSVMTQIPTYMDKVLQVDIVTNGLMSALPYIAMYLLSFLFGAMSDFILKKNWLSTTACRKLSNSIGQFGPALALVALTFAPVGSLPIAVVILIVAVGLNAGHYTGFLLVHIDMSPNFAGSLMSVTNFASNFVSIFAPLVAGLLVYDETDASEWMVFFFVTSGVYVACNLCFLVFGTSERQPWDEPADDTRDKSADTLPQKISDETV